MRKISTLKQAHVAVKKNGRNLEYVPEELKTVELILSYI